MEYKKDIDHKGLIDQQSVAGAGSLRGSEGMSLSSRPNGMEAFTITLAKKCERLATAIYLVTNFLSDTEPLKSRLRILSLDLVREAALTRTNGHMTEGHNLDVLRGTILETLSLLELSFISGLLSEMNFSILKREYTALRDSIEIKKASRESRTDTVLGETFFGSSFHADERPIKDILAKGHNNNSMSFTMSDRNKDVRENPSRHIDALHSDPKNSGSVEPRRIQTPSIGTLAPHPRIITSVDKEARQSRILKLVKENHEIMVKDITAHFPGLSEKTLQRELVALVSKGVLKKTGERRWSRYSLF